MVLGIGGVFGMRIESCRNCGNTISVLKYCNVCKQPKQLRCETCSKYVDDPIHSKCDTVTAGCN